MNYYKAIKNSLKYGLLISTVVLVSCTDDLESESFGDPVLENFYETLEQGEQALIGAYSPLSEIYGDNFWAGMGSDILFGDIGTDDIIKGGRTAEDNAPLVERERWALTTSNPIFVELWKLNFKGILFSNLVLENIPNIAFDDEDRKREILAEAHFLRAFYYFDLVNSFGGVPLIDKPLKLGEFNVPRATLEASYAFIEEDLKAAIADLPSRLDKDASYQGRADKGAALGMMMRVSLYQNKMNEVVTYGDQLFALSHDLTSDFSTIFQPEGEWNIGSLFEINFISDANLSGTGIPHRLNPRANRGAGFGQATEDLKDEYEVDDPRFDATMFFENSNFGTGWHIRKYAWAPYTNYVVPTIRRNRNSSNNIRIIRLADAYLMYAEAIYDTNAPLAVEYVNRVRTRARGTEPATVIPNLSATLSGQPLLDAIYHERRVELAGEGLRFHDLLRTNRATTILGSKGFVTGQHELIPIPVNQVSLSGGVLQQNNY
ncbi:RagB/SusD family nutrient uptake outer membrane protein [Wenyingzhuangia sp. IMCC45533]